jgi:hypothetical protein
MSVWTPLLWESAFDANQQAFFNWQDRVGCATAKPVGVKPRTKEIVWYDWGTADRDLVMMIAMQRTGKTVQAQFDMGIHYLSGDGVVVLAPTSEYESQREPQENSLAMEKLGLLGLKPEAFPIETFNVNDSRLAFPSPFEKGFSLAEKEYLIGALLGVDSPAQELAASMALSLGADDLESFEQGYKIYRDQAGEMVGQIGKMILDVKRRDLFSGDPVDFLSLLKEGKIISVVGSMSGKTGRTGILSKYMAVYFALALPKWKREGRIGRVLTLREESSQFLNCLQGQKIVEEELSIEGKVGHPYEYMIQDLEMAKRTMVYSQMSKACVLKVAPIPERHIWDLADFRLMPDKEVHKLLGMKTTGRPQQFGLIRPDNTVDIYDPFPCFGAFRNVAKGERP